MKLTIVSNRLPVSLQRDGERFVLNASSGGLVTALSAVLRSRGGRWIGWPGASEAEEAELGVLLREHEERIGFQVVPVMMSRQEEEGFYRGFSNELIWPLFHDLQSRCRFEPEYWMQYNAVNDKFADVVERSVHRDEFVWVHDYHLFGVARRLAERGVPIRLGFFLHIPFPPPDIFCKLPWRTQIIDEMLHHNLIGLQSPRDMNNLIGCIRALRRDVTMQRHRGALRCSVDGRTVSIGRFPIGIDYSEFADVAESPEIASRALAIRREMPNRQIVLSVDRLDYTKGIPDRLRAIQRALRRFPDLLRAFSLYQVIVPSREDVPEYQDLKAQIEQLVTQVNGEFTQAGWIPIHHVFRSISRQELIASYRAADAALITPLKDGMNLVAKEYCACQAENNGVLILSEFAGAAVQLRRGAILVNPYDIDQVADAIHRAVTMTPSQRRPGMRRLRSVVRKHDVHAWVDSFLTAGGFATPTPIAEGRAEPVTA